MGTVSPELVWHADEAELLRLIDSEVFLQGQPKRIGFYAPSFAGYSTRHFSSALNLFPTFSVTGEACALDCGHCGRKVLKTMAPTNTPSGLFEAARNLKRKGGLGCLVSGGCLSNGSVPLENFAPTLARMKKELGLTVMVHTGIIDLNTVDALKKAEIDAALIDIIGSDNTLGQICGTDISTSDYERSMEAMSNAGLNFVPHVIVGLENGKIAGEFHALEMISKFHPSALVVIAFMPIRGTRMANVKPPEPVDIVRVFGTARLMFPTIQISLGCMRPKGKNRVQTDVLALKAGADAIAFPSKEAIEFAEEHGFSILFSPYCCAQISRL